MKNSNGSVISVPFVLNNDGNVAMEAFLVAAREKAVRYQERVLSVNNECCELVDGIVNDPKYADVKKWSAKDLASMALMNMGKVPNASALKSLEPRVKSFLQSRTSEFLFVSAGRNAGFHIRSRYNNEELAGLVKAK